MHLSIWCTSRWRACATIAWVMLILFVGIGCGSTQVPTPTRIPPPTVTPFPTFTPLPDVPTPTPTATRIPPPLRLFPGFVDTPCAWNVPVRQLLQCLAKIGGSPIGYAEGSYVASRETLQGSDGKLYAVNTFAQGTRRLRNIDGTTYWDLNSLTPTPTATATSTVTVTATPSPQLVVGSILLYDFEADDLRWISAALDWVKSADPELWRTTTAVPVSVYEVKPDLANTLAAVSGLVMSNRMDDLTAPLSADRIDIRSDYVQLLISGKKGATFESNQVDFIALLARHLRRIEDYRAFRASGRRLAECADLTPEQEQTIEAAGFQVQLEAIQKISGAALAKGLVAPQNSARDEQIKLFQKDTDQWVQDLKSKVSAPQLYFAPCYPPTPTPVPTSAPPTASPTLGPAMGALILVNPYAEAALTINGPMYRIPAGGQAIVTLPAGSYTYSLRIGTWNSTGVVQVLSGAYTRFELPMPVKTN